jgi:rod shape-determining protein MreD
MTNINNINIKTQLNNFFPVILLFFSVLNEFDFNNLGLKYFSFNFSYILIFYYSLKGGENLGLVSIFLAGLFNDVITGLPMGISSLNYLLLSGAATYLRNITLSPSLLKDWLFFLVTLLCLNSISFIILNFFFSFEISYFDEIINVIFTFLLYYIFSFIFNFIRRFLLGNYSAG